MKERAAGIKLIEFLADNPIGEEILEGTLGGLMAGASQLGSDQPLGQTALETAAAIAGGIGLGMLGRRIGGRLGKAVQPAALEDQGGTLAFVGRTFGNETTAKGLKENAIMGREALKESILSGTSARMAQEAVADPAAFMARYGLNADQFKQYADQVKAGRAAAAVLNTLESMPPEQRQAVMAPILQELRSYGAVENAVAKAAHADFDEVITRLVKDRDQLGEQIEELAGERARGLGDAVSRAFEGLDRPVQQITGEHVGRAIGRFLGDEVGILGGLAAGSLLAQQLGMESPKDQRIRELEQQLARR